MFSAAAVCKIQSLLLVPKDKSWFSQDERSAEQLSPDCAFPLYGSRTAIWKPSLLALTRRRRPFERPGCERSRSASTK